MEKVLITGGSGFIGLEVKKAFSDFGLEVLTVGRSEKEDFKSDLQEGKVKNILKDFLPDIVCHFASGSNITRANKNKEKEFNETVLGTDCLIKILKTLAKKPKTFVYLSSQAVYGLSETLPVSESHPTCPVTVYGENKLKAEKLIVESGINYLIFRISSVYGPMQDPNKSGVVAKFVNKIKNNQSPIVFNSIDLYSDFIYISDVVSAIVKAVRENNGPRSEIFNLGSGKPTTLKQLLDILYKTFPMAPKPIFEVNSLYPNKDEKGLYLDITKIQTQLQWSCKYDIEEGLKLMIENNKCIESV